MRFGCMRATLLHISRIMERERSARMDTKSSLQAGLLRVNKWLTDGMGCLAQIESMDGTQKESRAIFARKQVEVAALLHELVSHRADIKERDDLASRLVSLFLCLFSSALNTMQRRKSPHHVHDGH